MEFIETIREEDLANGSSKLISVKGKDIALFKIDNTITALGNRCLHKGGPLAKGKIEKKYDGSYVTCPWHGWEYDPATGSLEGDPETHLDVYPIKVENGDVLVDV